MFSTFRDGVHFCTWIGCNEYCLNVLITLLNFGECDENSMLRVHWKHGKHVRLPSNCIEHCNFYLLVYYKDDLAINSFYVIHKGHESVIDKIGVGDWTNLA